MSQIFKHIACRNGIYAKTIQRFNVPDDLVLWSTSFESYSPENFESPVLKGKPWADPEITNSEFQPKFNELDGKVNRVSWTGSYAVENRLPLNPFGRTGESEG
jgi:ADP-ribose pyrophosphatase